MFLEGFENIAKHGGTHVVSTFSVIGREVIGTVLSDEHFFFRAAHLSEGFVPFIGRLFGFFGRDGFLWHKMINSTFLKKYPDT